MRYSHAEQRQVVVREMRNEIEEAEHLGHHLDVAPNARAWHAGDRKTIGDVLEDAHMERRVLEHHGAAALFGFEVLHLPHTEVE